ncbi:amidohydrolase family protein [Solirubrobacter taibaiensis]|nr:amidohydrolase family protein [Solirubrobacter taibaiensis]
MGFRTRAAATALVISCALPVAAGAQSTTPPRGPDEGQGPFTKLVIRGVNVIDGSGGTVQGPRDIVIQGNRITEIRSAGTPGLPMQPNRPPRDFDKEIDATGMWVMPGLVDEHVHAEQGGTPLTYAYKLWLAHGVTTVRGVNLTGNAAAVRDKAASEANTIVAPRIINYQRPGAAWPNGSPNTPEKAREWVRWASVNGVDGVKFAGTGVDQDKRILSAMIDEAKKLGLGTTMHHSPPVYPEVNAVETGRMGLGTVTHFYGHFESILKSGRTHPFPDDYNYADEQSRWRHVAKVIDYTFEPGSPQWWAYLNEQKANGVTFGPTMSVYEAGRDLMRARTQEWHRTYAMPSIWKFWEPDRENHGSFYYDWTTSDEVSWKRFIARYMQLVNDYKSIGGRVAAGTDAGFIYSLYGFAAIRELELMQEAGFTPHEAINAYTRQAARTLMEPKGITDPEFGMVRVGQIADLIITPENPLANFKTLYGTGTGRLNDATGQIERVGGIRWTVRNGVVYDAKELLADVAEMVQTQKNAGGCAGVTLDWSAAGPCGGTGPTTPPVPTPVPTPTVVAGPPGPPGPAGPAGAVGPKGDKGDTPNVRITCDLSGDGRSITCTISAGPDTDAKLKGAVRVQNTKRTVTRTGTGAVKVKLKAAKKLRKTQKLVVKVSSGTATKQFTVRVGKATTGALVAAKK